mgnify:CR=1 FL=1
MTATPNQSTREEIGGEIAFLEEAARYFERRDTQGEDRAHWANVYNAENCRKIAKRLAALQSPTDKEGDRLLRAVRSGIAFCSGSCDKTLIARIDAHLSRSIVGEGE